MQLTHNIARRATIAAVGLPVAPTHPEIALNVIMQAPAELVGQLVCVSALLQAPDGAVRTLYSDVLAELAGNLVVFELQEGDVMIGLSAIPTILTGRGTEDASTTAPVEIEKESIQ
jgi:hypothetical protein